LWLERCAIEEFVTLYAPRIEQFLRALEGAESEKERERVGEEEELFAGLALSSRMRESWRTGRFWFDFAARRGFDVDMVYWAALHDDDDGESVEVLEEAVRADMESFTRMKMEQLEAYKEECTARFSSGT
jgi:hypothetical protein